MNSATGRDRGHGPIWTGRDARTWNYGSEGWGADLRFDRCRSMGETWWVTRHTSALIERSGKRGGLPGYSCWFSSSRSSPSQPPWRRAVTPYCPLGGSSRYVGAVVVGLQGACSIGQPGSNAITRHRISVHRGKREDPGWAEGTDELGRLAAAGARLL